MDCTNGNVYEGAPGFLRKGYNWAVHRPACGPWCALCKLGKYMGGDSFNLSPERISQQHTNTNDGKLKL